MATQSRNPIPSATIPQAINCKEVACLEARTEKHKTYLDRLKLWQADKKNNKKPTTDFVCPHRANKATASKCPTSAFLYPRSIRIPEAGETFDPKVHLHFHQGIDLAGVDGRTEIHAVMAGTVVDAVETYSRLSGYGSYGRVVVIQGDDKRFYLYAHCARLGVKKGDLVREGQTIAFVGRTSFDDAESAGHEVAHCNELETWAKAGYQDDEQPQPPKGIVVTNKHGDKRELEWMGPHLHFEVSETPYPKAKAKERRPQLPYAPAQRLDPREVLAQLAGSTAHAGPKLYFPNGQQVTPRHAEALFAKNESQKLGGYFPVGANNFWHGGVHLYGARGEPVVMPMDGTVVAARLDEDPDTAFHDFGSLNFVLVRHDLPKAIADELNGVTKPPDTKPGGQKSGTESTTGDRSVGKKAGAAHHNEPADVIEIKQRLHAVQDPKTKRPFFEPTADDLLTDGTKVERLQTAIGTFQRFMGIRATDDTIQLKPRKNTYNKLLACTPSLEAAAHPADDTPKPSTSTTTSGATAPVPPGGTSASGEPAAPRVEPFFTLYMHLDARPLDAARAKQIPWLTRVDMRTAEEREQEEKERKEAQYEMKGHVGDACENQPDDVLWVQKRLHRFNYYPLTPSSVVTSELVPAIKLFQERRVLPGEAKEAERKGGDSKKKATADGKVSCNKTTWSYLAKTPADLDLAPSAKDASGIDPAFLARLRTRKEPRVCGVVSGLSVPIRAGEVVGTMGVGCSHNDIGLSELVHWGVFSPNPLCMPWQDLVDDTDDLTLDVTEPIVAAIERLVERDEHEGTLSTNEVVQYYNGGFATSLRYTRCLFSNEWSFTAAQVKDAFAKLGDPCAAEVAEQVAPYLFWPEVADVVPPGTEAAPSGKVWHYHPVAFFCELARVMGAFRTTLSVEVVRGGNSVQNQTVDFACHGRRMHIRTDANGLAVASGIEPGLWLVSATIEEYASRASETTTVEATVQVEPTLQASVTLVLPEVLSSM